MLAKNAPTQPNDVRDADKQGEHVEAIKATNMDQQYYYCVCVFSDNTMYTSTMVCYCLSVLFVCLLLLFLTYLSIPFLFVIYLTQFSTILISYIMGCQTQLVS